MTAFHEAWATLLLVWLGLLAFMRFFVFVSGYFLPRARDIEHGIVGSSHRRVMRKCTVSVDADTRIVMWLAVRSFCRRTSQRRFG